MTASRFMNHQELSGYVAGQPVKSQWGEWSFDAECFTLRFRAEEDREWYYIPLNSIDSSAGVLDWIYQIQAKTWADGKIIADLVDAIKDVLDPQSNYCSYGSDKRYSARDLAERYAERLRRAA